ncbi:hypothetical protein [Pseudomonas chlororaphis]|uniref:hypothetical protein n=1 Tax=Pseudomonas chlororaphis TaxID=587753 RepID=UPI0023656A05|nr:hypothetical protein [Pseudomonas chlororaphis]WDH22420.1 hypothetical protein PUP50_31415 [Pseudomonas chlororaphis]
MNKPVGPPPFIDNHQPEWDRAFYIEEGRALAANKARLDILRQHDKKKTQERIDGLYDDLQRRIDPNYKRAPNIEDLGNIFDTAQDIIHAWNW